MTYKIVERFLNLIRFKGINNGSLIAEFFALRTIDKRSADFPFLNISVLLKRMALLWKQDNSSLKYSKLIFTKLNNRFHCNELMNPLIRHYQNKGIILCDENYLNGHNPENDSADAGAILFQQTNNNLRKDGFEILKTTVAVLFILLRRRRRLNITYKEVLYFTNKMMEQLRKVSFWINYFNVADLKPLCVVTEFDRSSESAPLILAARKQGIPTITLIHGVPEDYSFIPFLADFIFCWGEGQKNYLISKGVDHKRIFVTGNPMFGSKIAINDIGDHSKSDFSICLAVSPGFDNRLLINPFVSALKHFDNVKGVLKLHPSLAKDDYMWVLNISPKIRIFTSQEIKNRELFESTDLLIINDSGIANESLAVGVPVVVFVPDNVLKLNDFQSELIETAGCRLITKELALTRVIDELLADPNRFKSEANEKSFGYLKNLYETTGKESINSMILHINNIIGGKH